ncbi:helix-turn-helix domain-containing protein [Haladaptatus sp. GCM10025707]
MATTLAISASTDSRWRVERITGPEDALDTLEAVYLNPDICNECIYPHPACDAVAVYEVLEAEPTARTIYRSTTEVEFCYSVSSLAVATLGSGLVFDAVQRGPYYEWRVLVPAGRDLSAFHEALHADLPAGVTLSIRRVGSPEPWAHRRPNRELALPYEQRVALETATRLGYYEHPRRADLTDIARELDLPLTTLRYRLRRAEAWAVSLAATATQPGGAFREHSDFSPDTSSPLVER